MSNASKDDVSVTLSGTLANYLAAILQAALFVFHSVGNRVFGKTAYGAYVFAWSIVELGGKIALCGFDKSLLRAIATHRITGDSEGETRTLVTAIRTVLLLGASMAVLLYALAGPIAALKSAGPYASPLRILAPVSLFWAGIMVCVAATMGQRTMRYNLLIRGISDPLLMVLFLAVYAVVLVQPLRDEGLVLAHLSASFVVLLLGSLAFARSFDTGAIRRGLFGAKTDWTLLRYSIPIALAELLNQAIYRTDVILIAVMLDTDQVANYGACMLLSGVVSSVRYAFDPILSPVVAETVATNDTPRLGENLRRMVRWVTIFAVPLFSIIALHAGQLLTIWDESYRPAFAALVLLANCHLLNATLGLHQWPVVMSGRSKLDLYNNLIAFVVNLLLNLVLIPKWQLVGAAVATLAGNVIFRILQTVEVYLIFRIHAFSRYWFKALLAGVVSIAAQMALLHWLSLSGWTQFALVVPSGLCVYGLALLALGLCQEDREIVDRLLRRRKG